MITAGIDAGSRAIKVALWDARNHKLAGAGIEDQGVEQEALARRLFEQVLAAAQVGRERVAKIVATGYGRNNVAFADTTITEITCHAVGVRQLVPDAMTIIEIGGQDSKLIRLNPKGAVQDFSMNDRCAAGTGCFLEMVARRLNVGLDALGALAAQSRKAAVISSMCAVFAETEIVGLLASGTAREDIVAGVQAAVAARVTAMAGRTVTPPVVFTGGVALIPGMSAALHNTLKCPVVISPEPQLTGALGAAILAARK